MCHKIFYQNETDQYTEAFDPDNPTLLDRYSTDQQRRYRRKVIENRPFCKNWKILIYIKK